jgi:hypothetical protein
VLLLLLQAAECALFVSQDVVENEWWACSTAVLLTTVSQDTHNNDRSITILVH